MSIDDPTTNPPEPPVAPKPRKKIGSMGILAAVLVVAALAAVYFLVLGPMMSGGGDSVDATATAPSAPAAPQAQQAGSPAPPPPSAAPAPVDQAASQPPEVKTAPAATPTGATLTLKPLPGEIVISGQVQGISADKTKMIVKVSRIHVSGRQETNLQPRSKDVLIRKSTTVTLRGVPSPASSIKPGVPVQAVGKNKGIGSVLYARKVAL